MTANQAKNGSGGKVFIVILGLALAALIWASMDPGKPEGRDDCVAQHAPKGSSISDKAEANQICSNQGR